MEHSDMKEVKQVVISRAEGNMRDGRGKRVNETEFRNRNRRKKWEGEEEYLCSFHVFILPSSLGEVPCAPYAEPSKNLGHPRLKSLRSASVFAQRQASPCAPPFWSRWCTGISIIPAVSSPLFPSSLAFSASLCFCGCAGVVILSPA